MFHATELLGQDGRLFLTELCRSPTPTSRQRILRHGFSYYSNQVRIRTDEYCGTGALIGLVYKRTDRTGQNGNPG